MLHSIDNVKRQSRTSQSTDANDPPGRAAPEVSAEYETDWSAEEEFGSVKSKSSGTPEEKGPSPLQDTARRLDLAFLLGSTAKQNRLNCELKCEGDSELQMHLKSE